MPSAAVNPFLMKMFHYDPHFLISVRIASESGIPIMKFLEHLSQDEEFIEMMKERFDKMRRLSFFIQKLRGSIFWDPPDPPSGVDGMYTIAEELWAYLIDSDFKISEKIKNCHAAILMPAHTS